METVTAPTLDEVNRQARVYPAYALPEGGSALSLFSAGFHGWNDVIHFYRKNMVVTCVDTNTDKLREMAQIYPEGWEFLTMDAWKFAEHAQESQWDAVSVDPFLGDAARRVWDTLPLWMNLSRRLLTVTVEGDEEPILPSGWRHSLFRRGETPRGTTVNWLVLNRD